MYLRTFLRKQESRNYFTSFRFPACIADTADRKEGMLFIIVFVSGMIENIRKKFVFILLKVAV